MPIAARPSRRRHRLHADEHRRARPRQQQPDTGISVTAVRKIHEGRPNLLDHLANGAIALIVNTPSGKGARTDEGRIRASAVSHGVPCITTVAGAKAAVTALERLAERGSSNVYALQDLLKKSWRKPR